MTIRIGDKVRFLNDVGGGIVSSFKSKEIVLVEDEDGFEIPMLIKECVIIEAASGPGMTTSSEPVSHASSGAPVTELRSKKGFEAYLAVTPEFEDNPLQGSMELYLVNDSNYYFYYLCEESASNGKVIADGLLHPNTHQPIGSYTVQELGEMSKMQVRLLPFMRHKEYKQLHAVEKTLAFNAVKLAKSKSYKSTPFLGVNAHLMPLHKDMVEESIKELGEKDLGKHEGSKSQLKSPKKNSELIEVDLHIEALLDDFSGMSKGEMLQHQLSTFEETLKDNKGRKGQRIVFIHGVGNGRLKTDIRNSLQRKFKLDFQDASFREYGYGATMVIIR